MGFENIKRKLLDGIAERSKSKVILVFIGRPISDNSYRFMRFVDREKPLIKINSLKERNYSKAYSCWTECWYLRQCLLRQELNEIFREPASQTLGMLDDRN